MQLLCYYIMYRWKLVENARKHVHHLLAKCYIPISQIIIVIIIIIIFVNKRPNTCYTFTPSKFNSLLRCSTTIAQNPRDGKRCEEARQNKKNKNYYNLTIMIIIIILWGTYIYIMYFIRELIFCALRTVK